MGLMGKSLVLLLDMIVWHKRLSLELWLVLYSGCGTLVIV